ncbi:hypothetical protein, partial [Mesorhizobium sp. M7A.F.Ca.MR.362.00.0.0]|uniref:hypothetical protein n=1 Tax=Mesorhizobium sp. M7A.F.Ca.MR.362.00.0.0 TaxID=2496779 RepID=UPI0019D47054
MAYLDLQPGIGQEKFGFVLERGKPYLLDALVMLIDWAPIDDALGMNPVLPRSNRRSAIGTQRGTSTLRRSTPRGREGWNAHTMGGFGQPRPAPPSQTCVGSGTAAAAISAIRVSITQDSALLITDAV